jgi:hypothetical protein
MATEDEIGRVVKEWFSLGIYPQYQEAYTRRVKISREKDQAFFDLLWEHPEYEDYFEIID